MAAAPYILARTFQEAHAFAREELGLAQGHYRVVSSPSTLSGPRNCDLYLVPGHENRHDRFAMRGALRYTRMNKIDVAALDEAPETPDGLNPPGTQPQLVEGADPALVAEFEAFLNGTGEHPHEPQDEAPDAHEFVTAEIKTDPDGFEYAPDTEEAQAEEPAAEPETKRRRRRCKECGVLVDPDAVEQHAAEHLPTED